MSKEPKKYYIVCSSYSKTRTYGPYTIEEAVKANSYTLEVGRSWQNEKGRYKIPADKSIKTAVQLERALYRASCNGKCNGDGDSYRVIPENEYQPIEE